MPPLNLLAEVLVAEEELNEAQRIIDHGRKTIIGCFHLGRVYLDRKQHQINVQRIKINAAKEYLNSITQ